MLGLAALTLSMLATAAPTPACEPSNGVVEQYVDLLYRQKRVDAAMELVAADLIQHSPHVKDGRAAWAAEMASITRDPTAAFEVREVLTKGDRTAVHFIGHLKAGAPGAEVFEIYRTEGGRIVEHWSAFQLLAP